MVWALQAVLDGNVTRGEIDQATRNEEWRHTARSPLFQRDGRVGDAFDAANAGADHDPGADLVLVRCRLPAGIVHGLGGGAHRKHDEFVDLALLLRLHPLVGIVGAVGTIASRNLAGDLRRQISDFEFLDFARATLAGDQALPCRLDAATKRGHHPHPCDDYAAHELSSRVPYRSLQGTAGHPTFAKGSGSGNIAGTPL